MTEVGYENPWFFRGHPLLDEQIEGYFGFVYLIINKTTGRMYIGRKNFQFNRSRKTKTSKRRKRRVIKSDWKTYYGSCDELNEEVKAIGAQNFHREVLWLCKTKRDLTYLEVYEQFRHDVLAKSLYYNTNILGRFFVKDKSKVDFLDPETMMSPFMMNTALPDWHSHKWNSVYNQPQGA